MRAKMIGFIPGRKTNRKPYVKLLLKSEGSERGYTFNHSLKDAKNLENEIQKRGNDNFADRCF